MTARIRRTIVETRVVIQRLPKPLESNYKWQDSASCKSVDPEIFFHPDNQRGDDKIERVRQAKVVCQTCPVIIECRNFAIDTRQDFGIWGGLDEDELYTLRMRIQREVRRDRNTRRDEDVPL